MKYLFTWSPMTTHATFVHNSRKLTISIMRIGWSSSPCLCRFFFNSSMFYNIFSMQTIWSFVQKRVIYPFWEFHDLLDNTEEQYIRPRPYIVCWTTSDMIYCPAQAVLIASASNTAARSAALNLWVWLIIFGWSAVCLRQEVVRIVEYFTRPSQKKKITQFKLLFLDITLHFIYCIWPRINASAVSDKTKLWFY